MAATVSRVFLVGHGNGNTDKVLQLTRRKKSEYSKRRFTQIKDNLLIVNGTELANIKLVTLSVEGPGGPIEFGIIDIDKISSSGPGGVPIDTIYVWFAAFIDVAFDREFGVGAITVTVETQAAGSSTGTAEVDSIVP